MFQRSAYDAVVVGSGPNGLCAGIALAQAGCSVLMVEARDTPGGGVRSAELTLPGFVHDHCASIFPLSVASPFIRSLPLEQYGLEWVYPPLDVAHPLDDGSAVGVERSLDATAEGLGHDGRAYRRLLKPLLGDWDGFVHDLLGPLPLPPRRLMTYARFSLHALQTAQGLARRQFRSERARAVFAGMAGHSQLALDTLASASFGIVISALAHAVGWPFPRGGAQALSHALAAHFASLGGELVVSFPVQRLEQLPPFRVALFDVAPRHLLKIVGERLPGSYRRQLAHYRYGAGVFKVDYALDGPIPWQAEACRRSATVHLGGTLEEIAAAERMVAHGQHPQKPYVLLAQHTLFDSCRAPQGQHTAWAYCHVPNGSTQDMAARIDAQIERFAPGFQKHILARNSLTTQDMEAYNPNYVGGDINTGVQDLFQLFTRPAVRLDPYSTPLKNIFICSSATPPGGGVHGMCGYYAAQSALKHIPHEK
jgi:phytoene dehydrogenase-like protein